MLQSDNRMLKEEEEQRQHDKEIVESDPARTDTPHVGIPQGKGYLDRIKRRVYDDGQKFSAVTLDFQTTLDDLQVEIENWYSLAHITVMKIDQGTNIEELKRFLVIMIKIYER